MGVDELLELQARAGQWPAAQATQAEAARRKTLPAPENRRRQAVLLHENAAAAEAQNRPSEAMRMQTKAHGLAPAFAPITARYAQMLNVRGHSRRARRAIEAAWRAAPHPALAEAYRALYADEPPLLRLKRMERLAGFNPSHVESRLALAAAALEARLWGEARRYLVEAGADTPDAAPPRVCRLMAELEEAEHADHATARDWLARAATAATLDPAWVCEACAGESASWAAVCPSCRGFGTLAWSGPGRTAPHRATPAPPQLAPPVAAKP